MDKAISQELRALEGNVRGPVLETLAGNYTTGFFQLNKMASTHITVQKLDVPLEQLESLEIFTGCGATFRISKTTTFRLLWQTSCQYWVRSCRAQNV